MSQNEVIVLTAIISNFLGASFVVYLMFTQLPNTLWWEFKRFRERDAEEAKSKLLESEERDEFEAWRRSKQGASSPSRSNPSSSGDSDDLDIHNPDNWYE